MSASPAKSQVEVFAQVHARAQEIVNLTETIPLDCEMPRFYFVVAYRWGFTNEHWYFVYVGVDRDKAEALAKEEVQERGGKYGCAVFAFNDDGRDYELVYYAPCMTEDAAATSPRHNHRLDYFERLGMLFDDACEGEAWLPTEAEPGLLRTVKVDVDARLRAERDRQRARLHAVMAATDSLHKEKADEH
jgi:hypothetical protein